MRPQCLPCSGFAMSASLRHRDSSVAGARITDNSGSAALSRNVTTFAIDFTSILRDATDVVPPDTPVGPPPLGGPMRKPARLSIGVVVAGVAAAAVLGTTTAAIAHTATKPANQQERFSLLSTKPGAAPVLVATGPAHALATVVQLN